MSDDEKRDKTDNTTSCLICGEVSYGYPLCDACHSVRRELRTNVWQVAERLHEELEKTREELKVAEKKGKDLCQCCQCVGFLASKMIELEVIPDEIEKGIDAYIKMRDEFKSVKIERDKLKDELETELRKHLSKDGLDSEAALIKLNRLTQDEKEEE